MKISGGKLRKLLKYSIVFAIVVSNITTTQKILSVYHDIVSLRWILKESITDKFLMANRMNLNNIDNFISQLLNGDYEKHVRMIGEIDAKLVELLNLFEKKADFSRAIFLHGYFFG